MPETKRYTQDEVVAIVNEIMIDEFEVDEDKLRADAKVGEELGLDSLDGVDMVVAIEKAFSMRIGEEEARSIRTLGDVYQRVLERLGQMERAVL